MPLPYRVLIVGAGNIGARHDHPGSPAILSHAHAFSRNPAFELLGFVDTDAARAKEAARVWGGGAFTGLADALQKHTADVVCICTPDATHAKLLMTLAEHPPRLVFCEKPLATRCADAHRIIKACETTGMALAVNYSRRYTPQNQSLRQSIQNGEYGAYMAGTGYYGKGTLHNGSHLVDLFHFLVGTLQAQSVLGKISDYEGDEPSLSACLVTSDGKPFVIQAIDSRKMTVFELDLIFERGRIRLTDLGRETELQSVREDIQYRDYQVLGPADRSPNALSGALGFAVENLHAHLERGEPLLCTGQDALRTLALCEGLLDMAGYRTGSPA